MKVKQKQGDNHIPLLQTLLLPAMGNVDNETIIQLVNQPLSSFENLTKLL